MTCWYSIPLLKVIILISLVMASFTVAGQINITGGISAYQPSEPDAGTTPLYFFKVRYWINDYINFDYEVDYARYKSRGLKFHYIPHKLGAEGHIPVHRVFDPYVGGGFVYTFKKYGYDGTLNTFGFSWRVGSNFLLYKNSYIGWYVEWIVPDYRDTSNRSLQYGIQFPGLNFSW
jgi:hypothetical protein